MDSPSGKGLVAVLAALGAAVGAAAAVVWHVAVSGPQDLGVTYTRPSWFPATLYLVAAGLTVGLLAASFLVDSGLRIVQDRQRSRIHLSALLIVIGAALGAGSALAWTHWPPQSTAAASRLTWEQPQTIEIDHDIAEFPQEQFGVATGGVSGLTTDSDGTYTQTLYSFVTIDEASTFTPTIGNPWLVFPIGGVSVAALAALTLSLRDFRLTAVTRSEFD